MQIERKKDRSKHQTKKRILLIVSHEKQCNHCISCTQKPGNYNRTNSREQPPENESKKIEIEDREPRLPKTWQGTSFLYPRPFLRHVISNPVRKITRARGLEMLV